MKTSKDHSIVFNRTFYVMFIILSLYQALFSLDYTMAASSMGCALVFDPFNTKITWSNRPLWQRAWLLVHLGIAAAILGYGFAISK